MFWFVGGEGVREECVTALELRRAPAPRPSVAEGYLASAVTTSKSSKVLSSYDLHRFRAEQSDLTKYT